MDAECHVLWQNEVALYGEHMFRVQTDDRLLWSHLRYCKIPHSNCEGVNCCLTSGQACNWPLIAHLGRFDRPIHNLWTGPIRRHPFFWNAFISVLNMQMPHWNWSSKKSTNAKKILIEIWEFLHIISLIIPFKQLVFARSQEESEIRWFFVALQFIAPIKSVGMVFFSIDWII